MAFPPSSNNNIFDDEGSDEGSILTIPTSKRPKNKPRKKKRRNDVANNEVVKFVQKYKLEPIAKPILSEGITIDFLIAQTDSDLDAISKELTPKPIQQKKFKFAVKDMQKANTKRINKTMKPKAPILIASPKGSKHHNIAIDKKTETKSKAFGNNKTITTWYFNGSDGLKHEIILKHDTKTTKNMKSKRSIIVDGKERYSKKSNDINFVIKECADDLRIEICHRNDNKSHINYELYINNVAFIELMNPIVQSFSL